MQIGEAARRAGLTVKTVRYYANIGLVTPQQDAETGYRLYDPADVAKLQFVGKARRFDFRSRNAANCWGCMRTVIVPAERSKH